MPEKKIFIVEDEPIVAMALEETLEELGYIVAGTATSGEDALERIGKTRPDLVLMDIRIEGDMDGIETAEKVDLLYHLPVVYLTAHSDEKTLERAISTQPHGFLLKPFRVRELYSTIEIALYKHRVKSRVAPPQAPEGTPAETKEPVMITVERAALDAMEIPVFIGNRDEQLVYCNPACETLFQSLGYKPVTGALLADSIPPILAGSRKEYRKIFDTGHGTVNPISFPGEGQSASFSLARVPITERGSVTYVAGILQDTTTEARLNVRILALNTALEHILSRLGEITAITSGKSTPDLQAIARHVSEIAVVVTGLSMQGDQAREKKPGSSKNS